MGIYRFESIKIHEPSLSGLGHADGHLLPETSLVSIASAPFETAPVAALVPRRTFLDGNFVRRRLPLRASDYCIWDNELIGFGLRVRSSGRYYWFVRVRQRGKQRRVTLGCSDDLDAERARRQARAVLAEVALDGLPKRAVIKDNPALSEFVSEHWNDLSRVWKTSTVARNWNAWRYVLAPAFGDTRVRDIQPTDLYRWRDSCAGDRENLYNRSLPVLASILKYAEALRLRRKGSNPCRGMPRYWQPPKERYLTPAEYRRLGTSLREEEARHPAQVAIIRLLLFTGARVGEIVNLHWDWVKPPRLVLPDSKTGPKTIWLNSQSLDVLRSINRREGTQLVFPSRTGKTPVGVHNWWGVFRRKCAMPDLRIHDLRHSFASIAIMNNVPLATIGKLLGHALTETTAKYAHLSDDVIGDAADRICSGLASAIGLSS